MHGIDCLLLFYRVDKQYLTFDSEIVESRLL
jgi:hypothetical protein